MCEWSFLQKKKLNLTSGNKILNIVWYCFLLVKPGGIEASWADDDSFSEWKCFLAPKNLGCWVAAV